MGGSTLALKLIFALTMLAVPSASLADQHPEFWSSEGDVYLGVLNANGVKLVSKYPKAWFHGEPSQDHAAIEVPAEIFFGKSCDAVHSELGAGTWGWWNDNFHATFAGHSIAFVNQELFDHSLFEGCEDHE